jgi:hypothetical protein
MKRPRTHVVPLTAIAIVCLVFTSLSAMARKGTTPSDQQVPTEQSRSAELKTDSLG